MQELKEIIERLLAEDERCRNDDKWLTFRVIQHYTKIYIPFEDFKRIPDFASVKRIRAHIQNKEGRFLPTDPEVMRKRRQAITLMQERLGGL
jgi:hypothetical protein